MGLGKGDVVEILSDKCCGDNVILMIRGSRIMLDHTTSKQIKVIHVDVDHRAYMRGGNRFRHRHALERRRKHT